MQGGGTVEKKKPPKSKNGDPLCQICKNEDEDFIKNTKLVTLTKDCEHPICPSCLSKFIDNQFLEKRRSFLLLKCPWDGCDELIPYSVFKLHASKKSMDKHDLLLKTIPPVKKEGDNTIYSMKEMGYEYTKDKLELRCIVEGLKGEKFHFISERHYNALGQAIVKHIQDGMKDNFKMKEVFLDKTNENNIFLSPDALTNKEKLLVLIQGSGPVRPGQWARSLCFNENLHTGSCDNYIEQAYKEGYGVIVLNPNHNSVPKSEYVESNKVKYNFFDPVKPRNLKRDCTVPIKNSESPPKHTVYVWDNFISKAQAKDIVIVAHSAGGWATMELLRNRGDEVLKRLRCVGFTDSVHEVEEDDPENVQKFILENAINWVTSNKELDTYIKTPRRTSGCVCLSAGHTVHENTSESCRTSLFKFFAKKLTQKS